MNNLQLFADAFETRSRVSDEQFTCLKDNSPSWMSELVKELHDNASMLPDDTRHAMISECATALTEHEEWEAGEIADSLTDVYNSELMRWLTSGSGRTDRADEAAEEIDPSAGIIRRAMLGQYQEYAEILQLMIDHFENEECAA